jgi:hypothetical protein
VQYFGENCGAKSLARETRTFQYGTLKFEPPRKKDQSADINTPQKLRNFCLTPQKKRKDQRMPMHTTEELSRFENELFLLYSIIAKIAHFQTAITLRFYGVNSCFKVSI